MTLEGKNALVTGSTRGIGLAVAEALLREGANLVVTSRRQKDIDEVVARLDSAGQGEVVGKECDVRDADQVQDLIEFCIKKLGSLQILINNAGIGAFKSVEEMSLREWRDVIATNLDAVFFACHFAVPKMRQNGGGFIINISSLAGKNAFANGAAYNASKFGLNGFSEALMQEVRHDDIRVAYIMPGSVGTSFNSITAKESPAWKLAPTDVADVVMDTLKRHPRCLTSRIEMRPSKPPRK
ncbi:MAG: SDR family oxidoreductase [Acidobacteriota bacterium]